MIEPDDFSPLKWYIYYCIVVACVSIPTALLIGHIFL
jgi:high-affinity nickel permease